VRRELFWVGGPTANNEGRLVFITSSKVKFVSAETKIFYNFQEIPYFYRYEGFIPVVTKCHYSRSYPESLHILQSPSSTTSLAGLLTIHLLLDFSSFSFYFLTIIFKKIMGSIKTTDLRNLAYFYTRLDVNGGSTTREYQEEKRQASHKSCQY
jgi:hypothetical protein